MQETNLPSLTFNELFIRDFLSKNTPCAGLGIVETMGRQHGFIAIKPGPNAINNYQNGFDLGTELLGNDGFAVLHLILNFSGDVYDVILDLGAAATKKVLRLWKETGEQFFFLLQNQGGLAAFREEIGMQWHDHNYFECMEKSNSTKSQYVKAVQTLKRKGMCHGEYLELNYQDDIHLSDLTEHRLEAKSH